MHDMRILQEDEGAEGTDRAVRPDGSGVDKEPVVRNSFVFYRSFYEAISCLEPVDRAAVYDAICMYALDGIEPECTGIVAAMFMIAKPQIDANNRKYINGKHGGRPKKQTETKPEPNRNQSKTKPEPKRNQSAKIENPMINVNDIERNTTLTGSTKKEAQPKHKYGEYSHVLLTDEETKKLKAEFGDAQTEEAIRFLDEYIHEKGYKSKSHYLALRRWVFDAVADQRKKARVTPPVNRFQNFPARNDPEHDEMVKQIIAQSAGR